MIKTLAFRLKHSKWDLSPWFDIPNGAKSVPNLFTWECPSWETCYWMYSRGKQIFAVMYSTPYSFSIINGSRFQCLSLAPRATPLVKSNTRAGFFKRSVSANPVLKVNWSINFSCIQLVFTARVLWSLRLFRLKTAEKQFKVTNLPKNWHQNPC